MRNSTMWKFLLKIHSGHPPIYRLQSYHSQDWVAKYDRFTQVEMVQFVENEGEQ